MKINKVLISLLLIVLLFVALVGASDYTTLYNPFGNHLQYVRGMNWSSDNVSFNKILLGDGSVTNPSIGFINNEDNGLYLPSADELGFVVGGTEGLRIDYNELEVQPMMTLAVGPIELEEDSGAVTVINLPVSSTPSDGDEESMTFSIDSNPVLTVAGLADGVGGADDFTVTIQDFLNIAPRSDAPGTPSEGDVYYDSDDHKLKVYNSTAWNDLN